MKKIQLLLIMVFSVSIMSAQTIEELRSMKAAKAAEAADFQGKADAINAEIAGIDAQITELTGWTTGLNGTIGFDFANSDKWQANPNPSAESSSLGLGITAFANKDQAKYFWNNKGIFQKAWQDVDIAGVGEDDDLFDQGTVDIINISSLAGYKLTPKLALSGLGELNTSLGNFLEPGTADIGIGATWLPMAGMTVVIHPLNYHLAWDNSGELQSTGALGAKIRADYGRELNVMGKKVGWSTTFTSYIPYSTPGDGEEGVSLQEYTWLNTLAFEVWRGIGVGVNFGFRQADFETALIEGGEEGTIQKFYQIGLNYGF